MAQPTKAPMAPLLDLGNGYTIRLTALDPTTGNKVTGVTVSNLAMAVVNVGSGDASNLAVGPFLLVPGSGA